MATNFHSLPTLPSHHPSTLPLCLYHSIIFLSTQKHCPAWNAFTCVALLRSVALQHNPNPQKNNNQHEPYALAHEHTIPVETFLPFPSAGRFLTYTERARLYCPLMGAKKRKKNSLVGRTTGTVSHPITENGSLARWRDKRGRSAYVLPFTHFWWMDFSKN